MYDLNHIYKVGNLILKLREEKGLSQSELGFKLGVTNKAVSRWENGRGYPDTSLLLKLLLLLVWLVLQSDLVWFMRLGI